MSEGTVASAWQQVLATTRRDMQMQLTYHFQILLAALSVPLLVLVVYFLGRLVGRPPELASYSGGYFEFALVGFVVVAFAGAVLPAFTNSILDEQQAGTLEMLLASGAGGLAPFLAGAFFMPATMALLQSGLFLAGGWLLAHDLAPEGLLLALPLLFATLASFCAFGIAAAAFTLLTKRGDPVTVATLQVTNLLAGALFPVTMLPGPLQAAAHIFPAFYGLEGMREVLLAGGGFSDVAGDLAVLCAFDVLLLPASIWLFARAVHVGRVVGTLGTS